MGDGYQVGHLSALIEAMKEHFLLYPSCVDHFGGFELCP